MMPPERSPPSTPKMARSLKPSSVTDGLVFAGGAVFAIILFYSLFSFLSPTPQSNLVLHPTTTHPSPVDNSPTDPSITTFYDDPSLSYTIDRPIKNWDEKRRHWLRLHPEYATSAAGGGADRILMVTGSQPTPCRNPIGDHLLLRFFKNKVDYCRLHNIQLFYNTVLLDPRMFAYWAKIPVLRAAMVAHPEAEWLYWVDSDAAFTDMEFALPLAKYSNHNLVLHGWPDLVFKNKSWTSLNAGVFLIRNCQWSLDFMDVWAQFGPQTPAYEEWGKTLRREFKDKTFPESDDQTGLAYLLVHHRHTWGTKIYLENEYYFEGYWAEIVGRLGDIAAEYLAVEAGGAALRRRRAEVMEAAYGRMRNEMLEEKGWRGGVNGRRRPFVTHFTGCQPCSGKHNDMYSGEKCFAGMEKALNFADDQVLRAYGFRHAGLMNTSAVQPLPFDFPGGDA